MLGRDCRRILVSDVTSPQDGRIIQTRLTIHLARLLTEHLLNLRVQVLHSVNIWCTRDAHEGRWIYLAARSRHSHLLSKVRWDPAGLGAGLAWIVSHAGSHMMSLGDAWMRLLHATRMRRKSLRDAGHHFVYRLSTCSGYRNQVAIGCVALQDRMRCLYLYTTMKTDEILAIAMDYWNRHTRPDRHQWRRDEVVGKPISRRWTSRYDRRSVAKDRRHSARLRG